MSEHRTVIDHCADLLIHAEASGRTLPALSGSVRLDESTAYAIQDELFCRRVERGELGVGLAVAVSADMRAAERGGADRIRTDRLATGWLTDAMRSLPGVRVEPGADLDPQLAFVLNAPLRGPGLTPEGARAAVGTVSGAMLIRAPRLVGAGLGALDLVADNLATSRYAISGVAVEPAALDLRLEACVVDVDAELAWHSTGAALGLDPFQALADAANSLAGRGHCLQRGWTILVGGASPAVRAAAGTTVVASFTHFGSVAVACGGVPGRSIRQNTASI